MPRKKKNCQRVLPEWLQSGLTCLNRWGLWNSNYITNSRCQSCHHKPPTFIENEWLPAVWSLQMAVCVDAPWKSARDLEAVCLWNARKTHTLAFGKVHRCSPWVLKVTDSQVEKHRDLFKSSCHPPLSVSCVSLLRSLITGKCRGTGYT